MIGIFFISILITTSIVFGLMFLIFLKIYSSYNPFNKISYWVSSIAATPILFIIIIFVWFKISSNFTKLEFDKAMWLKDRDVRYKYADDLIEKKKLIGFSRVEVASILGEIDSGNDSVMMYNIGYSPKEFMKSIPDWLEVKLKNNKVEKVSIQ